MSIPYINPTTLWAMKPDAFNRWRSNNDIPILLEFFKNKLPHFNKWMHQQALSDREFCTTVNTGRLLHGPNSSILIFDAADRDGPGLNEVANHLDVHTFWKYSVRNIPNPKYKSVVPYFSWAKKNLGNKRFFIATKNNKQLTDTITFNMWEGMQNDGESSRAYLFNELKVLKLGGLTINEKVQFGGRNLNFVDLDNLKVQGGMHGSRWTDCYFSSCRFLRIEFAQLNFTTFHQCTFEDFIIKNSTMQDIQLIQCSLIGQLQQFYAENSRLSKWLFDHTTVNIDLNHSNLVAPIIIPDKKIGPSTLAAMYRSFRIASQENGMRSSSSNYYYLERKQERKAFFSPYLQHRDKFPNMGYAGTLKDLFEQWKTKVFDSNKCLKLLGAIISFHLRVWIYPKSALLALKFKFLWLLSVLEEILWGYGERPSRIIISGLTILAFYSGIYYRILNSVPKQTKHSLLDCIYFSITTFTTLGYDHISPSTATMKILSGTEALTGVFMMGLFVAGFANRSRY